MEKELLQTLVAFRRELHEHPQISFREYQTHKRIKVMLLTFGVGEESIKQIAKEGKPSTGLIVDIQGQAEPQGRNLLVAFRADMDALSMTELNHDLPYKSKNEGAAHMCGHDGHVTCLLGFVPLFLREISKVPSNKKVRLLFQPSEEGPQNGAELMIEKGCLQGVDQIYGFHNLPLGTFGQLWCKEGPVMSQYTEIHVKIMGEGGHGSAPEGLRVAIWKAVEFYQKIQKYIEQLQSEGRNFVCTLPVFHSGQRFNVIGESAYIAGTLRTFENKTKNLVLSQIKQLLEVVEKEGFRVEFKTEGSCLTSNTKEEADNVLRVAKACLGQDKVGSGTLPLRASEDFGLYTERCPGAYFFFCTKKQENEPFLHNPRFNFKDELIETASLFWLKLFQDRISS